MVVERFVASVSLSEPPVSQSARSVEKQDQACSRRKNSNSLQVSGGFKSKYVETMRLHDTMKEVLNNSL